MSRGKIEGAVNLCGGGQMRLVCLAKLYFADTRIFRIFAVIKLLTHRAPHFVRRTLFYDTRICDAYLRSGKGSLGIAHRTSCDGMSFLEKINIRNNINR